MLREQICVQLPTHADNVALPAFARRWPCSSRSISPACMAHGSKPTAASLLLWALLGQTDGRTLDRCIDPAPRSMRTVPPINSQMSSYFATSYYRVPSQRRFFETRCRLYRNGSCRKLTKGPVCVCVLCESILCCLLMRYFYFV